MREGLSIKSASAVGRLVLRVRALVEKGQSRLESRVEELLNAGSEIDVLIDSAPDGHVAHTWRLLRTGLRLLAAQGKCLAIAHGDGSGLAAEQARLKILFGELQLQLKATGWPAPSTIGPTIAAIIQATECDPTVLTRLLLALPLPTVYWEAARERDDEPLVREPPPKEVPPPIVRLIAQLDNIPIATPTLIAPDRVYSLRFQVRGIGWPEGASALQLSLLSTFPTEEYSLSTFELPRPKAADNGEYLGELVGNIRFKAAQSTIFDDIIFRLRGAFKLDDGEFRDVPIIGYHEIRLRVVKQAAHPLMGTDSRVDRHIEELLVQLLQECPRAADEMGELQPLLQALNRLVTTYAQEAIYKGVSSIPEKEFHKTVLHDLRLILGPDVQNHPIQAGGIGDIRFRGVVCELKVEKDTSDRQKIAKKYAAQSSQYEGVEARQVSVLLVLDLTPKNDPPGDLRNDILLVDVPTHGGADDEKLYPSKAIVVVMNGNVKSPSDYSP